MSAASLAVLAAIVIVPMAALVGLLARWDHARYKRRYILLTIGAGALAFIPMRAALAMVERSTGLLPYGQGGGVAAYIYAFLLAAPLAQGLKVLAVWPAVRARKVEAPIDGIVYAAASALGFVSAQNATFLAGHDALSIHAVRALLAVPAHLFFAAAWGYALGRDGGKIIGGTRFNFAWLGAAIFNGVYDHIVFAQRPAALVAALPILGAIGVLALLGARDLLRRGELARGARRRRILPPLAPPSLKAMREALRRAERPVVLSWILFGALVTLGVMITAIVLAVIIGHRMGVDFAAVDRGGGTAAAAPLVLVGGAALMSFPFAGWLVARASRAQSVIGVSISAILAILGTLVLLGLAAPVAVVFAIAFAPIAFLLACVGAWLGVAR